MVKKMHDDDLDHDTDLGQPMSDDEFAADGADALEMADDEDEGDALADEDLPPPPKKPRLPAVAGKPPARPAPKTSATSAGADTKVGERAAALTADIPVQVVAVLGKKTLTMAELLQLEMGQLLAFGQPVSAMVDLVANGKLVAKGELVEIDGALGVKILKII